MQSSRIFSLLVIGVLLAIPFATFAISDQSEAAAGTSSDPILILPGQKWTYTPTFPSDLGAPTLTVSASNTAMPDDSATFDTTSGFATVSGTNIVVTIPSGTVAGNYYVKIKATFTNPPQNPTQEVYMKIQDRLTGSAPIVYGSESGATTAAKITSSVPVNYEVTDYDGLSAQKFSIDSTGNISLNVGEGDKGNYTVKVKLTAKDNATNIKLLDISVVVKSAGGFTSLPSAGYITEVGE